MKYLDKISRNMFSDLIHENPIAYFIKPLHGESLRSDFSVDVSIDGDCFTISAEIEQIDQKSEDEKIVQSERYCGSVSRTIRLPVAIDRAASSAHFENGILELVLSKEKKKAGKNLEIK